DVVFMDPPRAGSTEVFLDALEELQPEKVVYVSCDPVTQARDLKYLKKKGYQALKIQPVDMFPFTDHVETVALLSN
ncbi:MAG: 23S rRNA (uracil(1939)-C(5))-methyltransferase RlmD, partial [Eubacterium sp.]|nr:23S rRNA (uracil(1939)-C(5))-methyltransferase RlmD [Eubacterium sp.]